MYNESAENGNLQCGSTIMSPAKWVPPCTDPNDRYFFLVDIIQHSTFFYMSRIMTILTVVFILQITRCNLC